MIIFNWTLTPNQIRIIKGICDYVDAGEPDNPGLCPDIRNFVGGVKTLLKERLIVHTEVRNDQPHRWNGKTRPKWDVTEKGRVILKLVELEIEDQRKDLQQISAKRKEFK